MDTTNEKDHQDRSTPPDPKAETNTPGAPSKPASPSPARDASAPRAGDAAPDLSPEQQAAEIARLAEELRQQRESFRNLEVSLVTRIADVDDDRRHAATRLQRTLQAQRDELDARFKRQTSLVIALLVLLGLLVAGALAYLHISFDAKREALTNQIAGVRDALEQIAKVPALPDQDPRTREKLNQLTAAVEEISDSLERLGDEALPPPAEPSQERPPAKKDASEAEPLAQPASATPQAAAMPEEGDQPQAANPPEAPDTAPPPPEASSPGAEPATQPAMDRPETDSGQATEAAPISETSVIGDKPFAVQLMGFYSLESLQEFAKRHGLSAEYYYREETYQERPWFVLIHSLHESQIAADALVADLPPELAKREIWVRKLDSGKHVIKVRQTGD